MRFIVLFFLLLSTSAFSEELAPIEVTDQTLKIGPAQTEDLYFGFQEGDIIIFSFEELKEKALKEIEITELPSSSKYSDFKTTSVTEKRIQVYKKGVFKFSFKNGAVGGRLCKIHIQRIPADSESVHFNTGWKWETLYDTTYIPYTSDSIVGYDSTYTPYAKRELVSIDTSYINKEKNERVHTRLNQNGDRSVIWFDFPQEVKSKYLTKEIVSWAWWFSTEDEPNISGVLSGASELAYSVNPVAGLALGVLSLTQTNTGRNIKYYHITDAPNTKLFLSKEQCRIYDQGDGATISHRSEDFTGGRFYLGFDNDHTYPVDVNIRFSVVVITKKYEDKTYQKLKVTPRTVELNKIKIVVKTTKIRTNAG